jgi:type VI secretion system protein ImpE
MSIARGLYQAGRLDEAIQALDVEVRDNPTDVQRRTFLFELLCFAGNYERAEKQLGVLGRGGRDAEMGALVYHSALHAERLRQSMFEREEVPDGAPARAVSGTLNGARFDSLTDADPRIGARLELFVAGQYTWLPFQHVASVRMERPTRLRDLLWAPAIVRASESFEGAELGEVLIPALAPLSWRHPDGAVRLGRVTEWVSDGDREAPVGQKMLLVDGEEVPVLEVRELVLDSAAGGS